VSSGIAAAPGRERRQPAQFTPTGAQQDPQQAPARPATVIVCAFTIFIFIVSLLGFRFSQTKTGYRTIKIRSLSFLP
jgi:hypothetical protein